MVKAVDQRSFGPFSDQLATMKRARIPPGPPRAYDPKTNLLHWMNANFAIYGEIYKASIFGSPVYVVSNPKYCEQILRRNWTNYVRKGQVVKRISLLLGNGLISSNGEFWKRQRQMLQPAFSKNALSGLLRVITKVNTEFLEHWKTAARDGTAVNITHSTSSLVLKITLMSIFGDDYNDIAHHFSVLSDDSARNLEFAVAFRPLGKIIQQIVVRRRRDNLQALDFLGRMMQAQDRESGNPMPNAQLARETITLIVAGHETTASLLNWMWYLLSMHPDVESRLSAEFDRLSWNDVAIADILEGYTYTRQVIDEVLRLYPPLWLMTRKAVDHDYLGEFFVPAGTEIYISPYLIHRNPRIWEAPHAFDPARMHSQRLDGRHELAFIPFGAGPRNCIGEAFARLESQVHLMMFAKVLRLRCPKMQPPGITTGMNLLSDRDFHMTPEFKTTIAR